MILGELGKAVAEIGEDEGGSEQVAELARSLDKALNGGEGDDGILCHDACNAQKRGDRMAVIMRIARGLGAADWR